MNEFKLHSKFKPTGDQPQAIDSLVKGIEEGKKFQTLLGVTGSGRLLLWRILLKEFKSLPWCWLIIKL